MLKAKLVLHHLLQYNQQYGARFTDSLSLHNVLHSMKLLTCSSPLWLSKRPHAGIYSVQRLFKPRVVTHIGATWSTCGAQAQDPNKSTYSA